MSDRAFAPHLLSCFTTTGVFMCGWPHRYIRRLGAVGIDVISAGPSDGPIFIISINDMEAFVDVPNSLDSSIWTDRIELIGRRISGQD